VLTNVLNNACAYTDPGGRIEILVRREGDEAVVDVRDSGVGIPVEELDKVFEMFTRLTPFRDGQPGLGVGLTLSRQIVEMHGGRMSAHSDGWGHGATISVHLPAPAAEAAPAEPSPEEGPAEREQVERRRVLVVDDNVDAADMMAILLEVRGHEVRTAYDGRSAISETEVFRPDALLLDLGLPDLDGVMVCKAIKSQPWGKETVVVALSGWGQEEDKRRTAEAGFDAHLTKPARIEQVTALLERPAPARG
jgi:CheY-like chemotaxis protein